MPSIKGNRIVWDATDFLATAHPQYTSTLDSPIPQVQNKVAVLRSFDPYRFMGYASPGINNVDVTNVSVVTSVLKNVCLASESSSGYAYFVSEGSRVQRFDYLTNSLSNAGSWPHTISGAATEEGSDIVTYDFNVSGTLTRGVFYSWNDSGASTWDVGVFNTDAGTFDDDFMTTVPAGAPTTTTDNLPHPMIVGDDGCLYIGDGNVLHCYDGINGTNGTFFEEVLLLPSGYIITSFAKLPYRLVVFAYVSATGNRVNPDFTASYGAIAVEFNYLDPDPVYTHQLNDFTVTAGFNYKGTVGCFTEGIQPVSDGDNRYTKLQLFNGTGFDVVQVISGNAPDHGGVDIRADSIQWSSGGVIFSYGSPQEGNPVGMNLLTSGDGTTNGVLRYIGTGQYFSTGTTTSGGLERLSSGQYKDNLIYASSIASPDFSEGMIGKMRAVQVEFAKLSTAGRTVSISFVGNFVSPAGTTQVTVISNAGTITASNQVQRLEFDTSGNELPAFTDLQLVFAGGSGSSATDAPIIKRVTVYYDEINITETFTS